MIPADTSMVASANHAAVPTEHDTTDGRIGRDESKTFPTLVDRDSHGFGNADLQVFHDCQ
jgi:hypothetical protein